MKRRREASEAAMRDMLQWFDDEGGTVAIYDATNGTHERRKWLHDTLSSRGIDVLFIESICEDQEIILKNIRDVKLSSPDYEGQPPELAAEDFMQRIRHYEEAYESITEDEYTYIKLINVGKQYIINKVRGYLESKIISYLMNLHIRPRRIWFSRVSNWIMTIVWIYALMGVCNQHGESQFNVEGKIGGDAELSPRGEKYASRLPGLIAKHLGDRPLTVWTSSMKRTIQTARHLPYPKKQWKALDELDTGVCDGMTYEEIAASTSQIMLYSSNILTSLRF